MMAVGSSMGSGCWAAVVSGSGCCGSGVFGTVQSLSVSREPSGGLPAETAYGVWSAGVPRCRVLRGMPGLRVPVVAAAPQEVRDGEAQRNGDCSDGRAQRNRQRLGVVALGGAEGGEELRQ